MSRDRPKSDGLLLLQLAAQMEEVLKRLGKLESERFRQNVEIYRLQEAVEEMIDILYYEEQREGEPMQ